MSHSKKHENQGSISEYRNFLLVVSFVMITAGLIGFVTNSVKNKKSPTDISTTTPIVFPARLNFLEKTSPNNNILNVLSASTASVMTRPSATPTPLSTFRQSKFQFSFEVPKGASMRETDPSETILVANSSGGAFIEIPGQMQIEIGVVRLLGLNIDKYHANRLAMIFDEEVISQNQATSSANLKGYELKLRNFETNQDETLILLPFRGDQIFEIKALFLTPYHTREDKIFEDLVQSLKPY